MPSRYKDVYDVLLELAEKGVFVVLSFTKDGKEYYFTDPEEIKFIPAVKENFKWLCEGCYEEQETTIANIIAPNKKLPTRCRPCTMSEKMGSETNYSFRDKLEEENWEYCDSLERKITIKSLDYVNVKCSNNHPTQTTPNRWKAGHRCKTCSNNNKKVTMESIKLDFENSNFKLDEKFTYSDYIDNKTTIPCICRKCKKPHKISLVNLRKNIGGCGECSGLYTFDEMLKFLDETKKIFKSITIEDAEEDYKEFVLNEDYITYDCSTENCNFLNYRTTWRSIKEGNRCPNCAQKKREETNLREYGVDNPSKNEEIKKKIPKTHFDRTGYNFPMQNPVSLEKMMKTNRENHNGVHNFQTPENRILAYQGQLDKYGCMFLLSEEGKKKMLNLYGVEHPMKNPELFEKMMKSAHKRKEFIFPSGRKCNVQGYEPFALKKLLDDGIEEDVIFTTNIPTIPYMKNEKEYIYHPDIMIKSNNNIEKIIEVKSEYTLKADIEVNTLKFFSASKLYNFEVWVFDNKGKIINILYFVEEE